MKIIFNVMNCGLGNNGGSFTLINSANILSELGCNVCFIDTGKNNHTWSKLNVEHLIIKNQKNIPKADVVIATGYKTFKSTLELNKNCGRKYVWLRGLELWNTSEDKFIQNLLNPNMRKIVNSLWLKNKLSTYNINSELIRPGYDFNNFFPLDIRSNKEVVLGGLFNSGEKRKTKRTEWISKTFEILKHKYKNLKLYMFGSDGKPSFYTNKFIFNPTIQEKNELYNQCHIWLAPTCLEGLHICPAEAMQTECIVVGTNAPMNGMYDYLEDNVTGFISENNFDSFVNIVDQLITNYQHYKYIGINAQKKILSLGSRKDNMLKFVELFRS